MDQIPLCELVLYIYSTMHGLHLLSNVYVWQYVMLYGLRSLFSTYPPGSIASTADLDSITSTARRDLASLSPLRRPRRKAPEPVTVSLHAQITYGYMQLWT